jgi:lipopolysaccharide/colanic/teichoic acid biosynthesis glycosyltransferase
MRVKRQKLAIILSYELFFFAAFCFGARKLSLLSPRAPRTVSAELMLLLAIFFLVYFYQMWRTLYSRDYHYYLRNTYRIVLTNTVLAVLTAVALAIPLGMAGDRLPRMPILLVYLAMGCAGFSARHASQLFWVRYLSRLGYFSNKVLVVGSLDGQLDGEAYRQLLGGSRQYAGAVAYDKGRWSWTPAGSCRRRGVSYPEEIKALILKENVGEVVISLGEQLPEQMTSELEAYCQGLPISYSVVTDLEQLQNGHVWRRVFPCIPASERFARRTDSLTAVSLKRLLDLAVCFLSLLLLPLAVVIALAIKLEDGGPVFYISTRIGKNGKPLRFFKFRTMVVNAEQQKSTLLSLNERPDGPLFKMARDPRVTRVGRVLRGHNLDELPQLLNVWLGNMSLVGPRPHLPEEVAAYREEDYLRLECMPGIVGLPQLVGRRMIGFREWVEQDLRYRRDWSLGLDLRILWQAVKLTLKTFAREREPLSTNLTRP